MSSEREALITRAKELGINTFQKSSAAIAAEIKAKESGNGYADPTGENGDSGVDGISAYNPDVENDDEPDDDEDNTNMYGEDFPEETEATEASTPAAAPVNPAMIGYLAAQKYVEQMIANMPKPQAPKPEVSEAEITARLNRDAAAIDRDKKVMFGLEHGGGFGEPDYYTPCVNGKPFGIVVGAGKKPIPLAVVEVMERSFAQRRKNMATQKAMSKAATEAGI